MRHSNANGKFIGQHGSWNRRPPSGYRIFFVPFAAGKLSGSPIDVLTGLLSEKAARMAGPTVWRSTRQARGSWPTTWAI